MPRPAVPMPKPHLAKSIYRPNTLPMTLAMPPLPKGVKKWNGALETETNASQKEVVKGNRGKVAMTVKIKTLENKLEIRATQVSKETKKRVVKDLTAKIVNVNQLRKRNIETAMMIAVPRKDRATGIEIGGESAQTMPILEKTERELTRKRKIFPKRRVSVVFSQNFSANRLQTILNKGSTANWKSLEYEEGKPLRHR